MEPVTGFHDTYPTIVLDFSSLYPSIIQRYNLCFSTRLASSEILDIGENNVHITPESAMFVKSHIRPGILPEILTGLIKERNNTKRAMKSEHDEFKRKILNGKQLALKISANSIYGFTGDATSNLYCVEISSSVTGYGREMLEKTKTFIENSYQASVIYGDTDSVMFNIMSTIAETKGEAIERAIKLGKEIAATITDTLFTKPISLEFEKVMFPLILCSKKRYCGLSYTDGDVNPKMDVKGLQAIRRDSCTFIRETQSEFLKALMQVGYKEAIDYLQQRICNLKSGNIAIEDLVITKLLRSGYKNPQEHSELQKKMLARDASTAPQVGERVPFVYIDNGSKKACEKAEDPTYIQTHSLPIDYKKYLIRLGSSFKQILPENEIKEIF